MLGLVRTSPDLSARRILHMGTQTRQKYGATEPLETTNFPPTSYMSRYTISRIVKSLSPLPRNTDRLVTRTFSDEICLGGEELGCLQRCGLRSYIDVR